MRRSLSVIVLAALFLGNIGLLKAEDLLPSDAYYKNNIAVNEVAASSPTLRGPGDAGFPGGPGGGNGGQEGGGGQVNSPIGDAVLPLLVAGLGYGAFILYRSRRRSTIL